MTMTITFIINGKPCQLNLRTESHFSISGIFDGSGGQCIDSIRVESENLIKPNPALTHILQMWDNYHLNREPSVELIKMAVSRFEQLDKSRLGLAGDIDDLHDISPSDDIVNSLQVAENIEIYSEVLLSYGVTQDELLNMNGKDIWPLCLDDKATECQQQIAEDYISLRDFADEFENYAADYRYGESAISSSYFDDYVKQLAEDIGAVNEDAEWPNNHIDWGTAADQLKGDYSVIEWCNQEFYVR